MKQKTNIGRYSQYKGLVLLKVFFIIFANLTSSLYSHSQSFKISLSERVKWLIKSPDPQWKIQEHPDGVLITHSGSGNPDTKLFYWNEIQLWVNYTNKSSVSAALQFYRAKQTVNLSLELLSNSGGNNDLSTKKNTTLSGKRIALDPGHFAHNFETARLEKKYVRLRGIDMKLDHDIEIYEAKLTALTAEVLKDMLTDLGAKVMVTRTESTTATGKNFDQWFGSDFRDALEADLQAGWITQSEYEQYKKNSTSKVEILRTFFKDHEFRARAKKINEFGPDLTLIMHYNVDENNVPDKSGYHRPHDKNFSMVFVGGAFTSGELEKEWDRMYLMRQLFSNDVSNSIRFSAEVEARIETHLGVPAYRDEFPLKYIDLYSIKATGTTGVYHRNLYLNRAVYGTLAFAEPLLQDNREEAKLLSTYDCEWNGKKVPCRLVTMAEAYRDAIVNYLKK